jgi:hypothetical protein
MIHEKAKRVKYLNYSNLIIRTGVLARKVTGTRSLGAAHLALGPNHVWIRVHFVRIAPPERGTHLLSNAREALTGLKKRRIS